MRVCHKSLLALMFALLACSGARAGELDLRDVAEGARWFVHFDADAARHTTVGAKLHERGAGHEGWQAIRQRIIADTGLDPESVRGMTAYGLSLEPHQGVMLLEAPLNQETAVAYLQKKHGYQTSEANGYTLHHWTESHHDREHPMVAAFHSASRSVVGPNADLVVLALSVLDGQRGSLAGKVDKPSAGAVLVARGMDLVPGESYPGRCPVLKDCTSVAIEMGEANGVSFAHVHLACSSESVPAQVRDVISGLKALAQLRLGGMPEAAAHLSEALQVQAEGQHVSISFEANTAELIALGERMKEEFRARMEEHRRRREEHGHHGE